MVVDCETHVFERIAMPDGARFDGCRVEDLLSDMDRVGVDRAFLMAYTTAMLAPSPQFPDASAHCFGPREMEYFVESWQAHRDRFWLFNITDPRQPGHLDQLREQLTIGLSGLGETQPGYQYLMPDGPEFMEVYRFAAEHGLPIVVTMEGWDQYQGYFDSRDFGAYFDMFERVFRQFPTVRFMIGHGGNCGSIVYTQHWEQYLAANKRVYRLMEELDNLWLCVSMPWWITNDAINPLLPRLMDHLRDRVGFERVSWGSDWPWVVAEISFNSAYETPVQFYNAVAGCDDRGLAMLLGGAAYEFATGQRYAAPVS